MAQDDGSTGDRVTEDLFAGRHPSQAEQAWAAETLIPALRKAPEKPIGGAAGINLDSAGEAHFTTVSGRAVRRLYTPADLPEDWAAAQASHVGLPGQPPYTRGIHSSEAWDMPWMMQQSPSSVTPEEANERCRYLLANGAEGLSVAFDLPTQAGCDSDDVRSAGRVGEGGVAIDSLEDMEVLFRGIDLETTAVAIHSPAAVLWAMYLAAVEKQGGGWDKIPGTLQNDILEACIAQKESIVPPERAMRLAIDISEFSALYCPCFHPLSVSGYHIREAGSTALQELALTLYDGVEYVEWALRRSWPVDDFAPRLNFSFSAHNDFFEEIAKFRAARKIWYRLMKERFGARKAAAQQMRLHTRTAGASLTRQQAKNNIARVAVQALAAVLGGAQSLHTNGFDEAFALPSDDAARIALRTQQILAHEAGAAATADPMAGSYYVESLTLAMEQEAFDSFSRLDAMGGMVHAIARGFPQQEIAKAKHAYRQAVEAGEKIIVGVNEYVIDEPLPQTPSNDERARERQTAKLKRLRAQRSQEAVERSLHALRGVLRQEPGPCRGALSSGNAIPHLLDCARAYATIGEICGAMRDA